MGCVQSQPSHPSKHHSSSKSSHHSHSASKNRRSQEFYHQYQPGTSVEHNQPQINHSSSNSAAVISSNEGPRQRISSKSNNRKEQRVPSAQQQLVSEPTKRIQLSLDKHSPNKSLDDKEPSNSHNVSREKNAAFDRSSSSKGIAVANPAKDESTNEDVGFKRQHFDRNSIYRNSTKKRGRKASVNSTGAGNSTPGKNTDPNSNTSVKDQNKDATPNNRTSSNGMTQVMNNSILSNTRVSEETQPRVLLDKKTNITNEVNALYRENIKNIENKTFATTSGDQKYISTKQNQYNDINEKTYGLNSYCDKEGQESRNNPLKSENGLSKTSNLNERDFQVRNSASNYMSTFKPDNARNKYKEVKEIKNVTHSASDNVAALLGKTNSTKNNVVEGKVSQPILQQKHVDLNITKSRTAIKSNGIKENTAPSGSTVIRTRREAMRQAEEEEAAKTSGRTPTRKHSSNNGNDNNRGITTQPSKKNEKPDRITQEEDCGRLI